YFEMGKYMQQDQNRKVLKRPFCQRRYLQKQIYKRYTIYERLIAEENAMHIDSGPCQPPASGFTNDQTEILPRVYNGITGTTATLGTSYNLTKAS
ncbi:MAG: hypothetical protein Q9180_007152, partial [Flavoplaca navasiana]